MYVHLYNSIQLIEFSNSIGKICKSLTYSNSTQNKFSNTEEYFNTIQKLDFNCEFCARIFKGKQWLFNHIASTHK